MIVVTVLSMILVGSFFAAFVDGLLEQRRQERRIRQEEERWGRIADGR